MKDYSINSNQKEQFILSYEVKNGEIVAKLANRKKYVVPYTEENEKKILKRMEEQVNNARYENTYVKVQEELKTSLIACSGFAVGYACLITLAHIPVHWIYAFYYAVGMSIVTAKNILKTVSRNKDLEKMEEFLEQKEELNNDIKEKHESKNLTLGLNSKAKKEIAERIEANEEPLNVNNVRKLKLKELRTLKANIERIKAFGLEEKAEEVIVKTAENLDEIAESMFNNIEEEEKVNKLL